MQSLNAALEQTTPTTATSFAALLPVSDPESVVAEAPVPSFGPQGHEDRDALLLQHLAMVRFVARRVHERVPNHVDLDDLISAGVVGLLDAASKFDWTRQVQFKSYAQIRVRGAILDSLRVLDWSPRELRRKGRAIAEAIRLLSARLGRTPTDAEIAGEMALDLTSYQMLTGQLSNLEVGSLNVERNDEIADEELDFLEAPAAENPLAQCMEVEQRQRLIAAIERLPEKERLVLTLYYFEEMTLKEIGLSLGVVESRISQIRGQAVAHLRRFMGVPRVVKGKRATR